MLVSSDRYIGVSVWGQWVKRKREVKKNKNRRGIKEGLAMGKTS